ncbi:MAG TPA: NADP-dependent oxidoreductase [bacterium]|jgi:NADPH:quinone reductase-like Zn-dependent oxidoreductase
MKAAQISEYGHADVVEVMETPEPRVKPGQVLLEVHASSINPIDSKLREGSVTWAKGLKLPVTLGSDVAGIVQELGDGVSRVKVGDRVYGSAGALGGASGALAEFAVTPAESIARMPRNLDFPEAAAIALTGTSALQAFTEHFKLKRGDKILIHGGAGGIGTVAIQIARNIGAFVASTATGDGVDYVKSLGADQVIDYKQEDFDAVLKDFDAVFDTIGGDTYKRSFKVLKKGGVIVSMLIPPDPNLMKQYGVTAISEQTKVNTEHLDALTKLIEGGVVTVHIDQTYPLNRIQEAFQAKDSGQAHGKISVVIKK